MKINPTKIEVKNNILNAIKSIYKFNNKDNNTISIEQELDNLFGSFSLDNLKDIEKIEEIVLNNTQNLNNTKCKEEDIFSYIWELVGENEDYKILNVYKSFDENLEYTLNNDYNISKEFIIKSIEIKYSNIKYLIKIEWNFNLKDKTIEYNKIFLTEETDIDTISYSLYENKQEEVEFKNIKIAIFKKLLEIKIQNLKEIASKQKITLKNNIINLVKQYENLLTYKNIPFDINIISTKDIKKIKWDCSDYLIEQFEFFKVQLYNKNKDNQWEKYIIFKIFNKKTNKINFLQYKTNFISPHCLYDWFVNLKIDKIKIYPNLDFIM